MAETEIHRDDMMDLTQTLKYQFAEDPMVCALGNMLMFYEEENRRKHVSPDDSSCAGFRRNSARTT